MEDDKIDNELKHHINRIFDNYEDGGADAGWLLLREKFPEQKKERLAAWWWYAAAAVVLLGLGIWFIPKPANEQLTAMHSKPAKPHPDKAEPIVIDTVTADIRQNKTDFARTQTHKNEEKQLNGTKATTYPVADIYKTTAEQPISTTISKTKKDSTLIPNVNNAPVIAAVTGNAGKNTADNIASDSAANIKQTTATSMATTNAEKAKASDAITRLLNNTIVANAKKATAKTDKKATFSIYTATYFNYAKGSDNQLNLGAGVSSDFRISKKLKLATGVAIAQNSLNYSSQTPKPSNYKVYASAGLTTSALATTSPAPLTSQNLNASLVGLDIPINLKFQFNPDKNDTYISAGLSSGTFINETYTTNYNYRSGYSLQTTTQQSIERKSFSGFDLAKTLNVSFGMGYPLGKSNRLIIEPFLKYPLDGLGAQDIRFGAGGINLKLNFHPIKK